MNPTLRALGLMMLGALCVEYTRWGISGLYTSYSLDPPPHEIKPCNDVLPSMLRGRWEEHDVSTAEKMEQYEYYNQVLKWRGVPYGLQRADGKCGRDVRHSWYRALCHPGGPTPCCYNPGPRGLYNASHCVNAPSAKCTCDGCYDLRTQIEADHATWRTDDPECQPRKMAVEEICSLLDNATLLFLGDSLCRHLYIGVCMAVSGSEDHVFTSPDMPPDKRALCRGRTLFHGRQCTPFVYPPQVLCGGRVTVKYLMLRNLKFTSKIIKEIVSLGNTSRTLVALGFGIDDRYNFKKVQNTLWKPLLEKMRAQNLHSPRLVWTTPHVMGPINSITKQYRGDTLQDFPHVKAYIEQMTEFLRPHGVPVLSSFNITLGVMTHDGQHHGIGVNRLRAHVLLRHIEELQRRGQWS